MWAWNIFGPDILQISSESDLAPTFLFRLSLLRVFFVRWERKHSSIFTHFLCFRVVFFVNYAFCFVRVDVKLNNWKNAISLTQFCELGKGFSCMDFFKLTKMCGFLSLCVLNQGCYAPSILRLETNERLQLLPGRSWHPFLSVKYESILLK